MQKNIVINVAFNISNPLHDELLKASQEIKDMFGSDWYMDDKRFLLHMSVYLFAIPQENREKIADAGLKYSSFLKKVAIKSEGLIIGSNNLVILDFRKNKELYRYHLKALELFNPIRESALREKYEDRVYFNSLPAQDKENLTKFGDKHVKDKFHPHITIARLGSETDCKTVIKRYNKKFSGRASETTRLQIHEAQYFPENKNILLLDKELY